MKYTVEYCKSHDIVVICDTYEEYRNIKKFDNWSGISINEEIFKKNAPCYFFENSGDNGWDSCASRCFKDHGGSIHASIFIIDNSEARIITLNKSEEKCMKRLLQKL